MDPILFKQQLEPLKNTKYPIDEILKICYPLRGVWDWNMLDECNKSLLRIFKLVHLTDKYLLVEPDWITDTYLNEGELDIEYDQRWGICWDKSKEFKTSYLYTSLEELLEQSESSNTPDWQDYLTSSSESSDTEETVSLTESVKEIEFSEVERDQYWKDKNPAYNPRLIKDLENKYINPPLGFSVENTIEIIKRIWTLKNDEFLAADGSGDISNEGLQEFGIYGKERSMKSVKMIRFFEMHADEYSLDIDVSQWIAKAEKRTNPWKWIRVGPGFYRDFDWMFLGDQDCITKTIRTLEKMGYKPLPERVSGKEFDFDPAKIFKLSAGKCLDIDTGKEIISKADPYHFVTKKENVLEVRGYIFDYFKKQYEGKMIPGKKNRWVKEFLKKLKKGIHIDFTTLKPIKYTATTNMTHTFSKLGFAISKEEKNFQVRDIERAIKEYN